MKKGAENLVCSVARTIDILGDRWIFLIIREAFFGIKTNEEFQRNLGIATNILSDRLKRLVENGIFKYGEYTLYKKEIKLQSDKIRIIHFFSKEKPDDGIEVNLPNNYEVKINKKTGVPYISRKK